jgi:hypothetical protein
MVGSSFGYWLLVNRYWESLKFIVNWVLVEHK